MGDIAALGRFSGHAVVSEGECIFDFLLYYALSTLGFLISDILLIRHPLERENASSILRRRFFSKKDKSSDGGCIDFLIFRWEAIVSDHQEEGNRTKCPITRKRIQGFPHLRPIEYKRSRLSRNRRTVNCAYGGVISAGEVRERIAWEIKQRTLLAQYRIRPIMLPQVRRTAAIPPRLHSFSDGDHLSGTTFTSDGCLLRRLYSPVMPSIPNDVSISGNTTYREKDNVVQSYPIPTRLLLYLDSLGVGDLSSPTTWATRGISPYVLPLFSELMDHNWGQLD
ncbi:hypothetical protein L1887_32893 [Cichorium endivia]|nr:hypothetical protein L1887_32893 [Cichorium endivia]